MLQTDNKVISMPSQNADNLQITVDFSFVFGYTVFKEKRTGRSGQELQMDRSFFIWKCVVSNPSFCHQNILHSITRSSLARTTGFFLFEKQPDALGSRLDGTLNHLVRSSASSVEHSVKAFRPLSKRYRTAANDIAVSVLIISRTFIPSGSGII